MKLQSFLLGSLCLFFTATIAPASGKKAAAQEKIAEAERLFTLGAFEESVPKWKQALELFSRARNVPGELDAAIRLAAAYQSLGQYRLAVETLENASALAEKAGEKARLGSIKSTLGTLYTLSTQYEKADKLLGEGLALARKEKDLHAAAVALNNLANLHAYQQKYEAAAKEYKEGIALAGRSGDAALALKASANFATAALSNDDLEDANKWAEVVMKKSAGVADSHEKAYALLGAGKAFEEVFLRGEDHDNRLRLRALAAFERASQVAQKIDDKRALAYALAYEGGLYEMERKYAEALTLTRKAVFLAQQLKSPDMLYRWEWQTGRILGAQHERDAAIAAYKRAASTLAPIRHDVALRYGNPNAHSSFREVSGPLYFELADLLLQRADSIENEKDQQACLLDARETTEQLKSAELEDYFQDDCVNLLKSKITKVETISNTAAVIYIIPLARRTEMLVSLPSGRIERIKLPVTAEQLEQTATLFRFNLEKRTTNEYLDQSKELYDVLIKPLEPLLAKSHIDTLVFVPDGALRTIPLGALSDGQKFLIEKFAVAVTPGLTLMEPKAIGTARADLIVSALSEGVQGFAPLDHVPQEIAKLKSLYGGTELMNRQFVKPNMEKEFAAERYTIVHIASHGHFDSDARKTFVLTFDSKLSLNELEQLIRPSQLRDQPVELLTMSACQTAAGDDRAALGLAGIAIKAGARSALATLWFVNDETSSMLMGDFYSNLRDNPGISKAKALQNAQAKLLSDPRYGHPCYWAPYLLIGNWL